MLAAEVLARYDREMRQDPVPDAEASVERVGSVVRLLGSETCVLWAEVTEATAGQVVAEQAEFARRSRRALEWKTFGHDRAGLLEPLLARAGFVPEEPETLVAFDLEPGPPPGALPRGVEVRRAVDDTGARDAAQASLAAFGEDHAHAAERYRSVVRDPHQVLLVAYADGRPVAAGRVEMPPGRSFASLWGGGTDPAFRHRGVYRGLVNARGAIARAAGYRFLTVDAQATSRPILERLGFVVLTTTRPWTLRPVPSRAAEPRPGG